MPIFASLITMTLFSPVKHVMNIKEMGSSGALKFHRSGLSTVVTKCTQCPVSDPFPRVPLICYPTLIVRT